MGHMFYKGLFLLCLCPCFVYADGPSDVSLRFHSQWKIGEREQRALQKKYGSSRVSFDGEGHATPNGLTPAQAKRWKRLYELCMSDGCYFCDSPEGSCENHTCGPKNAYCKPYLEVGGVPKCGKECADYAFTSTLI